MNFDNHSEIQNRQPFLFQLNNLFHTKHYKHCFSSLKSCKVISITFSNIKKHIAQQGAKYKQANTYEVSYG